MVVGELRSALGCCRVQGAAGLGVLPVAGSELWGAARHGVLRGGAGLCGALPPQLAASLLVRERGADPGGQSPGLEGREHPGWRGSTVGSPASNLQQLCPPR